MENNKEPRLAESDFRILLSEVGKRYDYRPILADINLQINAGELVIICGRNAAGKSTFLRMIAGLDKPSDGQIKIIDNDHAQKYTVIGLMGHDSYLYDQLSAEENLLFFADMYGLDSSRERISELLEEYGLSAFGKLPSGVLSRGTKQRLSFARALVNNPDILLLDEPFAGLDPVAAQILVRNINLLINKGYTIILTTHEFSVIGLKNFRLLVLGQKTIIFDGLCQDIKEAKEIYEKFLKGDGFSRNKRARIGGTEKVEFSQKWETGDSPVGMRFFDLAARYLKQVAAVMKKDWRTEIKTRESINVMLLFSFASLIIYSFAFNLMGNSVREIFPGILWTTLSFTGILGLYRAIDREFRNSCVDALRLAAVEESIIFLGKSLGIMGPLMLIYLIISFMLLLLFSVNIFHPVLFLINLVGIIGFASAGTVLTTLAEKTSAKEILLPVLLLPVLIPLLLSVIQINLNYLNGLGLQSSLNWIKLLVVYNFMITAVSMLTYRFVLKG